MSAIAPGTRLGPYEIHSLLGAGGMGEVYRARDARLGRDVAVKVLPRSFVEDPDRLKRFEREARAAGQPNHPNVFAIRDIGSDGTTPFIVSELLEGEDLRARLNHGSIPSPEQIREQVTDHRTDIFALGAILHEMLTGERAFQGASHAGRGERSGAGVVLR